jgi:molybdate transport system regulatory protein
MILPKFNLIIPGCLLYNGYIILLLNSDSLPNKVTFIRWLYIVNKPPLAGLFRLGGNMRVITRIRIGNTKIFMGKGVKELLDALDKYKSIKKASEITGISYPKAIRLLKTFKEELGFDAVVSVKGGNTRGGTFLTDKGRQVLECYREIEREIEAFSEKLVKEKFTF